MTLQLSQLNIIYVALMVTKFRPFRSLLVLYAELKRALTRDH